MRRSRQVKARDPLDSLRGLALVPGFVEMAESALERVSLCRRRLTADPSIDTSADLLDALSEFADVLPRHALDARASALDEAIRVGLELPADDLAHAGNLGHVLEQRGQLAATAGDVELARRCWETALERYRVLPGYADEGGWRTEWVAGVESLLATLPAR